jgi:hypothetical protein
MRFLFSSVGCESVIGTPYTGIAAGIRKTRTNADRNGTTPKLRLTRRGKRYDS